MKYKLRDMFAIEVKGEVIVGPAEVELDEAQAKLNEHKLEAIHHDKPKKKKVEE